MKEHFLFSHGFGFDDDFWHFIKPYFSNTPCTFLDSGYFGGEIQLKNQKTNNTYIGIGHSLGLIKLLGLKVKFKALIGINAFINFKGFDALLHKKRTIELTLFKKNFQKDPLKTLDHFYENCGLSKADIPNFNEKIKKINTHRLLEHLNLLFTQVTLKKEVPTLIISSKNDLVVPLALIKDNFEGKNKSQIKILSHKGHLLGLEKPKEVYDTIKHFLNEHS